MVQPTPLGQALTDLEREIGATVRSIPSAPAPRPDDVASPTEVAPALAMPDYVEHRDGATEIGKLSAEAMVREFEVTAKEIEAIGVDLIERVGRCEAITRDAMAVTEELKETAARYRDQAKRVFAEIEDCSLVTAEVRKTCSELKERIALPRRADRSKPKKR